MTILDSEIYLKPISDAEPCGEALDYDLSFLELEMAARGKPGQQLGSAVIADEPPNWAEVARLADELSLRSKDLRIAVLGARASFNLEGLAGFGRALEPLAVYVERYWPDVHPRPDAEDGDDETVRINALADLCDPEGVLAELRRMPLTQSRIFGNFSLRDWLESKRPAADGSPPPEKDLAAIESSFQDTPFDILEARSRDLGAVLEVVTRIDKGAKERINSLQAVRFDPIIEALQQMLHAVDEHRPAPIADMPSDATGGAASATTSHEIRDRNDIIGMLDRICRWYRTNEPASPVPALLERTKRLVSKDFMALLLELAPAGATQFRALAGLSAEGEQQSK
ncbi:MAG: type VI secretion system protein TssA [Dongiaceae bacterium]